MNGNGGALSLTLSASSKYTLGSPSSPLVFDNCTAYSDYHLNDKDEWVPEVENVGYGGAIYITGSPSSSVSFNGISVVYPGNAEHGRCIYIDTALSESDLPVYSQLVKKSITSLPGDYVYKSGDNYLDLSSLITKSEVKIDSSNTDATDDANCGVVNKKTDDDDTDKSNDDDAKPCKTFTSGINSYYKLVNLITVSGDSYTVPSSDNLALDRNMTVIGNNWSEKKWNSKSRSTIKGVVFATDAKQVMTIGDGASDMNVSFYGFNIQPVLSKESSASAIPFFTVTYGATLCLLDVDVTAGEADKKPDDPSEYLSNADDEKVILETSLINAINGHIDLCRVSFKDFTLADASLLNTGSNCISFSGLATFSKIVRNNGNGAVLSADVKTGDVFRVYNATFENCEVKNGNGGAVAINYSHGSVFIGIPEDKKVRTTFKGCSAKNTTEESMMSNDDEKISTVGLGGAIFLQINAPPSAGESLNITKTKVSGGSAVEGKGIFVEAKVDDVADQKWFWQGVVDVNGGSAAFVQRNSKNEQHKASEYAKKKQNLWWIWLIVGIVILVVIIVVVVIIIVCCCKKSGGGSSASDNKA